ncbi:MAG: hypothetical protein WC505_05345 [Patescibacteria group bacterium]
MDTHSELTPEQKKQLARSKAILWIGLTVIVLLGLAVAVYFVFLKSSDENLNTSTDESTLNSNAEASQNINVSGLNNVDISTEYAVVTEEPDLVTWEPIQCTGDLLRVDLQVPMAWSTFVFVEGSSSLSGRLLFSNSSTLGFNLNRMTVPAGTPFQEYLEEYSRSAAGFSSASGEKKDIVFGAIGDRKIAVLDILSDEGTYLTRNVFFSVEPYIIRIETHGPLDEYRQAAATFARIIGSVEISGISVDTGIRWLSQKDDQFGYSVHYPSTWKHSNKTTILPNTWESLVFGIYKTYTNSNGDADSGSFEIRYSMEPFDGLLEEWVRAHDYRFDNDAITVRTFESTELTGHNALYLEATSNVAGGYINSYFLDVQGYVMHIGINSRILSIDKENQQDFDDTVERMMSSFTFSEEPTFLLSDTYEYEESITNSATGASYAIRRPKMWEHCGKSGCALVEVADNTTYNVVAYLFIKEGGFYPSASIAGFLDADTIVLHYRSWDHGGGYDRLFSLNLKTYTQTELLFYDSREDSSSGKYMSNSIYFKKDGKELAFVNNVVPYTAEYTETGVWVNAGDGWEQLSFAEEPTFNIDFKPLENYRNGNLLSLTINSRQYTFDFDTMAFQ